MKKVPDITISLIWAMDRNRLIGSKNRLPWHLPADLQWFRRQTMGKPVLMGRKTFESIGKPLPGRKNLILSRSMTVADGCIVVHSMDEALQQAGEADELMVIGGAGIYRLTLAHATRLYITEIDAAFTGDTYFPEFDETLWNEVFREEHAPDAVNRWPYRFRILERLQ